MQTSISVIPTVVHLLRSRRSRGAIVDGAVVEINMHDVASFAGRRRTIMLLYRLCRLRFLMHRNSNIIF